MAEKEGFEPSKLPLFKGKIEVGVYLVCVFCTFFDTFNLCFFTFFKVSPTSSVPFRTGICEEWK